MRQAARNGAALLWLLFAPLACPFEDLFPLKFGAPPPESILRAMIAKIEEEDADGDLRRVAKDYDGSGLDLAGSPVPAIRDQEYLQHSSLWGHQYMSGGTGEGYQRQKPDGSIANVNTVKTDAGLPSYCDPPNPCPPGYGAEDGCLEEFVNSASFSRDYQAGQDCLCDAEHMFACTKPPAGGTGPGRLPTAGGAQLQQLGDILKKLKSHPGNPFLQGRPLSVTAKKRFPEIIAGVA